MRKENCPTWATDLRRIADAIYPDPTMPTNKEMLREASHDLTEIAEEMWPTPTRRIRMVPGKHEGTWLVHPDEDPVVLTGEMVECYYTTEEEGEV